MTVGVLGKISLLRVDDSKKIMQDIRTRVNAGHESNLMGPNPGILKQRTISDLGGSRIRPWI